jgi:hypothetical protein
LVSGCSLAVSERSAVTRSLPGITRSLQAPVRQSSDDVRSRPADSLVGNVVTQRFHVGDSTIVVTDQSFAEVRELEVSGSAELVVPSRAVREDIRISKESKRDPKLTSHNLLVGTTAGVEILVDVMI